MRYATLTVLFCFLLHSCGPKPNANSKHNIQKNAEVSNSEITVAFGSCNKHDLENVFWDDILSLKPDVFVWGGDNIYADTDDMQLMKQMYASQNAVPGYAKLKNSVIVTGVWDDHDYGLNDAGADFHAKSESQQAFLDFMDVPQDSPRRKQEGTYSSTVISKPEGSVKLLLLDTRYFRSKLEKSTQNGKRYKINDDPNSTILGEAQWQWLKEELNGSTADFNIIVSSIQFLSDEHGFEKWANFPYEVERMKQLLKSTPAKGIIFLSGDRHISEFSKMELEGIKNPVIDFTSSGLTHAYTDYSGEPNPYRVGEVVSETSFGILGINLQNREVIFKMMGDNAEVLQELKQQY